MNWDNNSIVIYSNFPFHVEDWAPPSVKSGVRIKGPAGDEQTNNAYIEAVIDLLKNPGLCIGIARHRHRSHPISSHSPSL
jgi:hypothetical protein